LSESVRGEIELLNVRKQYGTVAAVDGVSLAVDAGSFFSLLGPSGCGKTTTLRMIAGFVHPDDGDVLIDGRTVLGQPPHVRDVNMVFQQYALFPHMDVFGNIAFGLLMKRVAREEIARRVDTMLELVRLVGYGTRRPSELSGGEQQRVALARALVNRPSILLLDEPLAALDQKLRKQMQQELKSLQHEVGITFLYVTHDQEEAMVLSDRIAVMHQGTVQQVGTPEDVYERPRNRFVADFIGISNLLSGRIVEKHASGVQVVVPSAAGELPPLEIWARPSEGHAVGDDVTVSVRPERIRLSDGVGSESPSRLGTVIDRAYLGTDVQYRVRLDGGMVLTAAYLNREGTPRVDPGSRIRVDWSADDVRVLSE